MLHQHLDASQDELSVLKGHILNQEQEYSALTKEKEEISDTLSCAQKDAESWCRHCETRLVGLKREAVKLTSKHEQMVEKLKEMQKDLRNLRAHACRAPTVLANAVEKAKVQQSRLQLTKGGTYKTEARTLARSLVNAGCSAKNVNAVIEAVAKPLGLEVVGSMSARTVGRCIDEGGIAARVQIGFEIANAECK